MLKNILKSFSIIALSMACYANEQVSQDEINKTIASLLEKGDPIIDEKNVPGEKSEQNKINNLTKKYDDNIGKYNIKNSTDELIPQISNESVKTKEYNELVSLQKSARNKMKISSNDPLIKTGEFIQKGVERNSRDGEIATPNGNGATSSDYIYHTCRESADPIIKTCVRRRIVKGVKQPATPTIITINVSDHAYNHSRITVNLLTGKIVGANRTATVSDKIEKPQRVQSQFKLVSSGFLGGTFTDRATHQLITMPSAANNYTAVIEIHQHDTSTSSWRKKRKRECRNRLWQTRGVVYKFQASIIPKPKLVEYWSDGDCALYRAYTKRGACVKNSSIKFGKAESREVNGLENAVYRSHWDEEHSYVCGGGQGLKECESLVEAGCEQISTQCTKMKSGFAQEFKQTYRCAVKSNIKDITSYSKGLTTSLTVDPNASDEFSADDFADAVSKLSLATSMKNNIDGQGIIFTGQAFHCKKTLGSSIKNCCNFSGLLKNIIGGGCSKQEKDLATAAAKDNRCILVHDWYKSKKRSATKKKAYCCYQSKMARVFQEIARRQLGVRAFNNGGGHPGDRINCQGLNARDFARINFDTPFAKSKIAELVVDMKNKADSFAMNAHNKMAVANLQEKIKDLQEKMKK